MMHIKQTLPDIKARITASLQKYQAELNSLGDSMLGNSGNIILNIITEFCNEYRTVLEGSNQELSSIELSGGARISFVFHELYANGVKAVDPFDQVKDIDIRTILYNSSGSSPALFVGTTAFELIVKQQIKRLEEPSLKCVSLVYDELVRILAQLLTKQMFRRYPSLKEKFHGVVVAFFKKVMDPTNQLVKDLVAMESCYINTGHPDFLNGHRAMAIVNDRHNASKPVQVDPKTGKALPPSVPPRAHSPSMDLLNEGNTGFFGSFFAPKNKKKAAAMESPPPQLKASGTLSEKEGQEVEVISKCPRRPRRFSMMLTNDARAAYQLLLQHHAKDHDRHGPEGDHVEARAVRAATSQFSFTLAGRCILTHTSSDTPRTKCSANCSRTCTAPTSSRTSSRKATSPSAGGKSASRWSSRSRGRAKSSAKCSRKGHHTVPKPMGRAHGEKEARSTGEGGHSRIA